MQCLPFFVSVNSLFHNCPSVLGSVYEMATITILSQLPCINHSQRYQGGILSSLLSTTVWGINGIELPVRTTWRRLLSSDPPSVSTTWWGVTKTGLLW